MLKSIFLEDLFESSINQYVEELRNVEFIVIWGTGNGASLVYNFLDEYNISNKVKYYVDSNYAIVGTYRNGCSVISPLDLNNIMIEGKYKIIISSMFLAEIKNQILNLNIDEKCIDIRGFGLAKDYWTFKDCSPYKVIYKNIELFETVYNSLNDDFSKRIFTGILNSKIALDNKYLVGINSEPLQQYFEKDLIKLIPGEVFVDCGSYVGDTLDIFYKLTEGKFEKYIAIEADLNNFGKLNENIHTHKYENIVTYNLACWNEETTLKFDSNQTAGHIVKEGQVTIEANTLDNILENENVTFIKMDIEGAEENSLIGAKQIISKNKPILAICLYHGFEDLYKLPLIMKEYNNEYKFYIRHYTELVDQETVCYAIPENRLISY
ncbi:MULTISPECIES: FkbM family methyltransferase [unclassified Lysinibacillus]|uniref:FkbM family methyltransferase n=1 Tax=unclassified Lysinibacillus TaxID=2636778 RepID=UPI003810A384